MKRISLIGLGVAIGMLLTVGGWFVLDSQYTYQGVVIDPPARAADFELVDQNRQIFRLSEQRGQIILIFFGYTNCPDVCSITLTEFKKIKEQLGSKAEQVRFVMITVDPERDSPERIKQYLENFDPDFTGLTGEYALLEKVWKDYGAYQERQEVEGAIEYLVDHTARIYTIDKNGNWRLNYPFGMEANQIVQDLLHLLKES